MLGTAIATRILCAPQYAASAGSSGRIRGREKKKCGATIPPDTGLITRAIPLRRCVMSPVRDAARWIVIVRSRRNCAGQPRARRRRRGGEVVYVLRKFGVDASGLEPDEQYARHAREALDVPVADGFCTGRGISGRQLRRGDDVSRPGARRRSVGDPVAPSRLDRRTRCALYRGPQCRGRVYFPGAPVSLRALL